MNRRTIVWRREPLENIATIVRGITFASSDKVAPGTKGAIPCLRTTNVQDTLEIDDLLWVSETFVKRQEQWLQAGDTIISMANSHELVGKVAFNPGQPHRMSFGGFIAAIRPHEITAKYLYFAIKSPGVQSAIRRQSSQTVNIANISAGILKKIEISVASADEQKKIVAMIETHFSRLDAAWVSLKRAKANLKRARASVLKAAVEGRLVPTEAALARSEGRDYEPASRVLARSLVTRRANWSESGKGKFKEPAAPESTALTTLPEGWNWVTLGDLATIVGGIAKDSKQSSGRLVPYLRVANVQRGRLHLAEIKSIIAPESKIEALRLQNGDILLNEGGDRDKLGRGWIWSGEIPECIHQNHVFRARLWLKDLQPKYISHYANTQGGRYFLDQGKQTTNLASISLSKVKALPVALPPVAEQTRILAEVDRRLSVLDALELSVDANLTRCARLRESILKQAFEGRLLPPGPATAGQPDLPLSPQKTAP